MGLATLSTLNWKLIAFSSNKHNSFSRLCRGLKNNHQQVENLWKVIIFSGGDDYYAVPYA